MKSIPGSRSVPVARLADARFLSLTLAIILSVIGLGSSRASAQNVGKTNVKVHSALGGFILGYDIDQNGTEGVLSESVTLSNGTFNVATETFDQTTGKLVKIVADQKMTKNDFVTFGVVQNSIGLVEQEKSKGIFVGKRIYEVMNPLSTNKFTGMWTPPLTQNQIISGVGSSQGASSTAILGFNNDSSFSSFVFSSDVANNTFGPQITLTDTIFDFNDSPVMAQNTVLNTAVVASSFGAVGAIPKLAIVDLTAGTVSEFQGVGDGFVNGIAVDSNTNMACTTTEIDFSAEFYNLTTKTGFRVVLQGATNQAQSGGAVAIDPVNKLFLIGQEFSSVDPQGGSSILVYDEQGNFVEAINGLSLPASPANMALNTTNRTGFVIITPTLNALQQFTY